MRALNMQEVKGCKVDFDEIEGWPAGKFEYAYDALIRVLGRRTASIVLQQLLPSNPHLTPPGQMTVPANPNFSDSTNSTAASGESKPEHYTDFFAHEFVQGSLKVLKKNVRNIPWMRPDLGFYLSMTLVSSYLYSLMCRKVNIRKFRLGYQHITAKDDGGISLATNNELDLPHVFSIEVISSSSSSSSPSPPFSPSSQIQHFIQALFL
jgi:hypothetical protein